MRLRIVRIVLCHVSLSAFCTRNESERAWKRVKLGGPWVGWDVGSIPFNEVLVSQYFLRKEDVSLTK